MKVIIYNETLFIWIVGLMEEFGQMFLPSVNIQHRGDDLQSTNMVKYPEY